MRKYSEWGSYPLMYVTHENEVLCSECAEESEQETTAHANWEDPHLYCDGCSERIESAYAEPEVDVEEDISLNNQRYLVIHRTGQRTEMVCC